MDITLLLVRFFLLLSCKISNYANAYSITNIFCRIDCFGIVGRNISLPLIISRLFGAYRLTGLHMRLIMVIGSGAAGLHVTLIRLAGLHLRLVMVIVAGAAGLYVALIRSAGLHLRLTMVMTRLRMAMIRLAGLHLRFTGLMVAGLNMLRLTGLCLRPTVVLRSSLLTRTMLRPSMLRSLSQGNGCRGQNGDGGKDRIHIKDFQFCTRFSFNEIKPGIHCFIGESGCSDQTQHPHDLL